MARRTSDNQIVESKLLAATEETKKLGSILNLIEIKGYVDTIELAVRDLKDLENKKKELLAEVSKIDDANESRRISLENKLKPLIAEIESTNAELRVLKLNLENESELADKEIKDFQDKTKQEEIKYFELTAKHFEDLELLKEEKEAVKLAIDLLNKDLLGLKEESIKEDGILNTVIENKNKMISDIEETKKQIPKLNSEIKKLNDDIEVINTEKLNLKNQNKKIEEDGIIKLKELEIKLQDDFKKMEEERIVKRTQLKKVEDSLSEVNSKLETANTEYSRVTGMIAVFIDKKNDIERREASLKRKYEEAGFNW